MLEYASDRFIGSNRLVFLTEQLETTALQSPYNQKKFDNTNLYTSKVTYGSGNYSNTDNAGVFQLNVNNSASNSNANISGHLLFSKFYYCFQFSYEIEIDGAYCYLGSCQNIKISKSVLVGCVHFHNSKIQQ